MERCRHVIFIVRRANDTIETRLIVEIGRYRPFKLGAGVSSTVGCRLGLAFAFAALLRAVLA